MPIFTSAHWLGMLTRVLQDLPRDINQTNLITPKHSVQKLTASVAKLHGSVWHSKFLFHRVCFLVTR